MTERDRLWLWFWFRQVDPRPPGHWVVNGPYDAPTAANRHRAICKGLYAAEVSIVFLAPSRKAAESMIYHQ